MKSVALEITDVKSEFEGGASFSLDWYTVLRQAAEVVIENVNPESLKRVVPIYGGLTSNLQVYYCPPDVRVPSRIYSNDGRRPFDYVASASYWAHKDWLNKFTIETVNGIRFIVIKHPVSGSTITLDPMNDPTGFTGGVSLVKNLYNVLPGSSASLQGTFSDTVYDISKVLTLPVDISPVIDNGLAIVPAYFDSAIDLDHITLTVKTDTGDYYTMTSNLTTAGDYFRDGQNMVRFWLAEKTSTGTPDPTNIVSYTLQAQMKSGKSQKVIFGKLTFQTNNLFFLEYFSNQLFVDGVTGAWKSTPVKGDQINLSDGPLNIFHFEACRITIRKSKTERVDSAESTRMDTELARAYGNYYKDFPSSAEPVSYNISPDIAHGLDVWGSDGYADFDDQIGNNQNADMGTPAVLFADGEVPLGALNGTNQTFTLAHQPAPTASLLIVFNGEVLMEGSGYTIGGKTLTLLAPYYTITGVGFVASYRYYAGT